MDEIECFACVGSLIIVCGNRVSFHSPGDVVNLGIGIPEAIASVANEEGCLHNISLTTEVFAGKL